jgi:hypothetical protein
VQVHVPYCDIPVNKLFASVFLPTGYKYGEFAGILREYTGNTDFVRNERG